MNPIEKLCSISSDAIVSEYTPIGLVEKHYALSTILKKKNGFFAFEGALHFYPTAGDEISIESINGEREWIVEYDGLADGLFFFAQDIFGSQYCIRESDGMFCKFEVETGHVEDKSTHLSGLIELILKDFDFESGHTFAKEWQEKNRPLQNNERIQPVVPFVLGGEYSVDNLKASTLKDILEENGQLARQIKEIPEGAQVSLSLIPKR